jgi:mycofactocin precursor
MVDPTVVAPPVPEREPDPQPPEPDTADQPLVEADLLVEDVSIDGMCGVY